MELNLQEVRDAIVHFTSLGKEINTLKSSISGLREPYRAQTHTRPANYQPLAEFLNMDLEELNVVINHAIQNPNDLTRAALEHLVLVSKIQCSDQVNEIRQHRKTMDAKYAAELERYHAGMARLDVTKEKIKELQAIPRIQLTAVWLPVVDQLQHHCELHGHWVYAMSHKYQEYLSVLARNSKYVNYGEVGAIVVDWDQVRLFKPEHIRVVMEGLLRVYDDDRALTAPIHVFDIETNTP